MGKLTDAVNNNNLQEVHRLLKGEYKNSYLINEEEDTDRNNPLGAAARKGFVDIIQALIKAGAKVNRVRGRVDDATPLWIAAENGQPAAIDALVKAKANVNQPNRPYAVTPLWIAACKGHVAAIEALVKVRADVNQATSNEGATPLHSAAFNGHVAAIEALVKAKADVNQPTKVGATPLHRAARQGHATAIEALVKSGANVNQVDEDGETPLHRAARQGHAAAIEALVKANANVNQATKDGTTPLYMVAYKGHAAAIEALVKAGANVNQAGEDGATPLWIAAQKGQLAAIEALVKAGANVNQANKDGETPLHGAACCGHATVIEILLKAGADVTAKTKKGKTPLDNAGGSNTKSLLKTHIQQLEALKYEPERLRLAEIKRQEEEKIRQERTEAKKREEKKYIQTKEVASQGNSNAQFQLGILYETGEGTDKNITIALEWYEKAAIQKHVEAFKRLEEIATEGNASVQFKLGLMYEEGQGIVQNNDKAVEWYKKAVEQGHVDALERFKDMATKGNTIAQSTLGLMYENGRNVPQDLKLAFQWFDKAGDINNMERVAQRLLAIENARKLALPKTASSNQPVVYRREGLETEEKQVENAQPIISFHLVKKEGKINVGNSFTLKYHELEIGKELGRGAFGIVYQGTWKKHIEVAVKQLILTKPSPDALTEFQQEMNLMNNLRCPQIVQLYGVYTEPTYGIVMQYMPNGSLYHVLHSNKPLDWNVRYSIAVDITKGVAFLHSENILHRDLKSLNVLLDDHMKAKLTDFGLAKIKTETASTASSNNNQVAGTLLWMAPELFKRRAQCTQKSDIYSLGMTLWELASREIPFKDASNQAIARDWIEKGEREDIPNDTPPKVSKLITFCWNADAAKRPTADEAVKQLLSAELKQEQTESANFSYRGNFDSGIK